MKFISKFFWFWLLITLVYIILGLVIPGPLPYVLGLFVPYGWISALFSFQAVVEGNFWALVPPVLLVVSLFTLDPMLEKVGITSYWVRVIFYLICLFILTLLADMLTYGQWMSLSLLIGGGAFSEGGM